MRYVYFLYLKHDFGLLYMKKTNVISLFETRVFLSINETYLSGAHLNLCMKHNAI